MRFHVFLFATAALMLGSCSPGSVPPPMVDAGADAGMLDGGAGGSGGAAPVTPKLSCDVVPEGGLCDHEDPTFVARCVGGSCVPFGCDYCPKPKCHSTFCFNGQCRKQDEPTGTPCPYKSVPDTYHTYLGTCSNGICEGFLECSNVVPVVSCPDVPCASVVCNDFWCRANYWAAGTECMTSDGTIGFCQNLACVKQ